MSLLAHYRLDGDATDSIEFNDGSATDVTWVDGKLGQAGDFIRGVDNGVWIPHDPYLSQRVFGVPTTLSFSFWIYPREYTNYGIVIGKQSGGSWSNSTSSVWIYSGGIRFNLGTNESGNPSGSYSYVTNSPTLNEWHHITCVSDEETMKMYVDGVLSGETSISLTRPRSENNNDIQIGTPRVSSYSEGVNALIDDVRIYDHALSEREVRDLSLGLVTHLKLEDETNNSLQGGDVVNEGAVFSSGSAIGTKCFENDGGVARRLRVTNSPNVTKNQTIAMWLYPTSNGRRRNPWNRAYGGEGTITHETSGSLNYYYGTDGGNTTPYQGFGSSFTLPLDVWSHVAIVRDLDAMQLRWYMNGILYNSTGASYAEAALSTNDLLIGDGYTSNYLGRIDDARQYVSALSDDEILELYQQRASLDSEGNFHSHVVTEHNEYDESIGANNLVENGHLQLGDNTNFSSLTYVDDPTHGELLLKQSGSVGVFTNEFIPVRGNGVDQFDRYMISHEIRGRDEASRYYFMLNCYDKYKQSIKYEMVHIDSNTHTTLSADLVSGDEYAYITDMTNWYDDGTNNYHHAKTLVMWKDDDDPIYTVYKYSRRTERATEVDKVNNRLKLRYTYSGETIPAGSIVANSRSGGTYSYIGASNNLTDLDNWVYNEGTSSSTASSGSMRYGSHYIKVGWLLNRNATDPTTLIRNVRCWNIDSDQRQQFGYHNFSVDGSSKVFSASEVGVSRGLVAWYPLTTDVKDYADTNDATNNGAVLTADGYQFDATDDYLSINDLPSIDGVKEFTFSCWVYLNSSQGYVYWGNSSDTLLLQVQTDGLYRLRFHLDNDWRGTYFFSQQIAAWHMVSITWDGTNTRVYVNDSIVIDSTEDSIYESLTSKGALHIGKRSSDVLDGIIRDIRIYDRALPAEEIALLNSSSKISMTSACLYTKGQIREVYT